MQGLAGGFFPIGQGQQRRGLEAAPAQRLQVGAPRIQAKAAGQIGPAQVACHHAGATL